MSINRKYCDGLIILVLALSLGACNRLPDHARYIPKDAIISVGINFKSLSKKIAWNVISGSKLFKEMQKRLPEKSANEAVSSLDKSGIDFFNTIYLYAKADKRVKGGNRVALILPLADANAWESYVNKVFPSLIIKAKGERKEANLNNIIYLAWTKKVIIATNILISSSLEDNELYQKDGNSGINTKLSEEEIASEIEKCFNILPENSIINNKNFKELELNNHDFTVWVNYDQAMSQYMNNTLSDKMGGLSISNTLWKDAALAAGFDFNKGQLSGAVKYYVSEDLVEIGKEFGKTNAESEMIDRLPKENLDILMTWHLSPIGLKKSVEKTGLLGLVNMGLGTQGLNLDHVLGSFTGDMALVMNNLSVKMVSEEDMFLGQKVQHSVQKPSVNMTMVLKINNKPDFMQLFNLYKDVGGIIKKSDDEYSLGINTRDSVFILIKNNYAVVSNKYENATGFLDGRYKGKNYQEPIKKQVIGHPLGFFLDVKQIATNIDPNISGSPHDSEIIAESKDLLKNITFNGGEFKNNAFESHIDINFTNNEESSIIALMDYGMRLSETDKKIKE